MKNKHFNFFIGVFILILFWAINNFLSNNNSLNNKDSIKFAYILRSEKGNSYNDIYNEEVIRNFSRSTNKRVEIVKGSYQELKPIKDIDVFIDLPKRRVDIAKLDLSNELKYVLYTTKNFLHEDFFSNKKIALLKGEGIFLRNFTLQHYNNHYTFVDNIEEGFQLLEKGEVDGFFSLNDPIYMRNPLRKHIKKIDFKNKFYSKKSFRILNKDVKTVLERFIKSLDAEKILNIEDTVDAKLIWSQLTLSREELDFLKNKKTLRIAGDFDRLAPLAYYENKQLKGSIYEYFNILKRGTSLNIEYIKKNSDDEILAGLKNKVIDIDAAFVHARDIDGMVETSPYFTSQLGIFSLGGKRSENLDSVVSKIEEHMGATGIKIDPFSENHIFKSNLKTTRLYSMLEKGEIDYFTHSYSLLRHPYNLQDINNLRLYGVYDKKISFSLAGLEDNKVIIDIMDRLFQYLDHDEIRYKWEMTSSSLDRKNNYKKVVFLFGIALFFLLPYLFILKVEMVKIKKIEKELQETKLNLENALNIKSAFLANMSHEMRTPLTAVLGFNKLLIKKEEDSKKRELMKNIGVAANNLLEFINNVLDLSKLESGKIELKTKRINLYQMADDLEKISLGLKRSDDVVFKFIIAEDAPKYFMGDEVWLKEIILNLLGNAFKFTETGSVQLLLKKSKDTLIIKVRDTGIGMKNLEEDGEKIFKRYEQLDLNENRDKKGSGLGLAIVREVVELMEGAIHVKSIYNIGTTFTISLPIKKTLDIHDKGKISKLQGSINEENDTNNNSTY